MSMAVMSSGLNSGLLDTDFDGSDNTMRTDSQQTTLGFEQAEGSYAERRSRLGLALLQVQADLHLSHLCSWIFNVTSGGINGDLVKSYDELRAAPWGLCCSYSKARTTVDMARHWGLIHVAANRYSSGGQKANAYSIDWQGVSDLLMGRRVARPGASTKQPPALTEQPPALSEHPPALTKQPYKEDIFSSGLSLNPDPGPGRRPEPEIEDRDESPRVAIVDGDDGLRKVLAHYPELEPLSGITVPALPTLPQRLKGSVYQPLTTKNIGNPSQMAYWFRGQLASPEPVMPGDELHLLLTLALARYATRLPDSQVRTNRVAAFVSAVSRRQWHHTLREIPVAQEQMRELLESSVFT